MVGLLEVNPESLAIECPAKGPNEDVADHMRRKAILVLNNPTATDAVFKIQFTAPARACIQPNKGYIAGLDEVVVVITATSEAFDSNFKLTERLLVNSAKSPIDRQLWKHHEPRDVWKLLGNAEVHKIKVPIKFQRISRQLPDIVTLDAAISSSDSSHVEEKVADQETPAIIDSEKPKDNICQGKEEEVCEQEMSGTRMLINHLQKSKENVCKREEATEQETSGPQILNNHSRSKESVSQEEKEIGEQETSGTPRLINHLQKCQDGKKKVTVTPKFHKVKEIFYT